MEQSLLTDLTISERERLLKAAEARSIKKPIKFAPIAVAPSRTHLPLSFAQQRLWVLAQMEGGSRVHRVPLAVELRGWLDRAALKQALDRIVARHEALRTTFVMVDGEPQQRIAPKEKSRFHLLEHDLRQHQDARSGLAQLIAEEAEAGFDLGAGPLIRGRLVRLADQEHALLITMHHIVCDGWSIGVLFSELSTLYAAYLRGEQDPLPELAVQYADYAVWQRKWMDGQVLTEQAEYWKTNLAGAPEVLELPADRVRPARQDYAGGMSPLMLNEELTAGLKELSRRHGTTLYMTLLAGWAVLLARLSGQQDVVIGTPAANRGRVEIENLIGFFVNTLVLRVDVSGRPTVGEMLARVKRQALAGQQHQDIPFEQVVELVQPVRSLAHSPLFQVMFAWQDAPGKRPELAGLETGRLQLLPHLVSEFDLTLSLQEAEGRIEGGVEYATALFEAKTIERYLGYFTRLLEGMVAAGGAEAVDAVRLLGEPERQQVVHGWNQTTVLLPRGCVHELFEEQVEKRPDAVAVECAEEGVSYRELNARANRLAHYLACCGVSTETRVGVCLERSIEMVVALLGILKAGGAYVPLDVEYPAERLVFMLEDAGVGLLVTEARLRDRLPVEATQYMPTVCIDEEREAIEGESSENLGLELDSRQLVYVMYTSGSTGPPKAVEIEHRNVVRLARSTKYVEFHPALTMGHVSNLMFDASTFEIWGALLNGCRLAVIPRFDVLAPEVLLGKAKALGVSTLFLTTALYQECAHSSPGIFRGMEQVLFGGDISDPECVRRGVEEQGPREITQVYGSTEATTFTCCYRLRRFDACGGSVPIGRPIGNTQVYVVDRELEAVGPDLPGEICVSGMGVARGYGNHATRTAERFVPNPFSDRGERMYRTGDWGRWREEGALEFIGRQDDQVKIRGYRVELGKIEARLMEHRCVKESAVVVREDDGGEKRLIAYYTAGETCGSDKDSEGSVGAEELRAHLKARLPEYMVPAAFVRLDRMPRTLNGKVDRRGLPTSEGNANGRRAYEAPEGETESVVAKIWAEVLQVPRVGRKDSFFELGGRSLLAVQVMARLLQTLGVEAGISDLFARPVLSDFARGMESARQSRLPAITRAERVGALPLSFAQQRLWFLAQMEGASEAYHMPFGAHLRGKLDARALRRALDRIVARHEALRTSFLMVGGEPQQRIAPAEKSRFQLEEHDLRGNIGLGEVERDIALQCLIRQEAERTFDLQKGPLIRGRLIRLGEEEHALLITMHHIVSDEWSMRVIVNELRSLYGAFTRGEEDPLPELPVQYADYALWQRKWMRGEILQEQVEYWRKNLAGATELLEVPGDHPRPMRQEYRGEFENLVLEKELTAGLQELSRRHGTTLYMTVLAAWAALLGRLTGEQVVVVGTPVANRGRREIEGLIGFFVNTLALRLDVSGRPSVAEMLERAKVQVLVGQQHQDVPFEQVVEILQPTRSLAHSPVFQVMFAWQNEKENRLELPGVEITRLQAAPHVEAKFDLTLALWEAGEEIAGGLEYATSLYERATAKRYLGYLRALLKGMVADQGARLDSLPLLSAEERHQVVHEWNRTLAEYPRERCVQELFEEQVKRTPEAVAVVYEDQQLTYGELNRKANRLAHYLRGLGVQPDVRVGICVERHLEMAVALLGVLKAGGVYVPLDPDYPIERLRYMLADSAPMALLTQAGLRELFAGMSDGVAVVDLGSATLPQRPRPGIEIDGARVGPNPRHLAYVIYTSGSTGAPKGVMVEHRGMLNHLYAKVRDLEIGREDVVAQTASLCFDISVWQFLAAWLVGARVLIVAEKDVRDPEGLLRTVGMTRATIFETVPSMLDAMTAKGEQLGAGEGSFRRVLVTGEACSVELSRRWLRLHRAIPLLNAYGPTECSDDVTHYVIEEWHSERMKNLPVGKPLGNTQIYVLDREGQPVPVGVAGELFIGGAGVARGYFNRPELTADRFVPDPFSTEAGARMYTSGDLGRWLVDGNIEFLGRTDNQVKVRGYRIELGEIEARLMEHPAVGSAVVVAREEGAGEKRLVAYYTIAERDGGRHPEKQTGETIRAEQLRTHLAGRLPEYMVPAAYVGLEKLPLTPNGKVDRKRLPEPGENAYGVRGYEAPEGEIETQVAAIWAEVLKLERIGRHDNFFALGGHSMLAVTVIERMRQQGLQGDVRELFVSPTLAELAAAAGAGTNQFEVPSNRIPKIGKQRVHPARELELRI